MRPPSRKPADTNRPDVTGVSASCIPCAQVCLWNLNSAKLLHKLRGHTDVAYDAAWSDSSGLLASCSHDGTVRTWLYDPLALLAPEDTHADLWR